MKIGVSKKILIILLFLCVAPVMYLSAAQSANASVFLTDDLLRAKSVEELIAIKNPLDENVRQRVLKGQALLDAKSYIVRIQGIITEKSSVSSVAQQTQQLQQQNQQLQEQVTNLQQQVATSGGGGGGIPGGVHPLEAWSAQQYALILARIKIPVAELVIMQEHVKRLQQEQNLSPEMERRRELLQDKIIDSIQGVRDLVDELEGQASNRGSIDYALFYKKSLIPSQSLSDHIKTLPMLKNFVLCNEFFKNLDSHDQDISYSNKCTVLKNAFLDRIKNEEGYSTDDEAKQEFDKFAEAIIKHEVRELNSTARQSPTSSSSASSTSASVAPIVPVAMDQTTANILLKALETMLIKWTFYLDPTNYAQLYQTDKRTYNQKTFVELVKFAVSNNTLSSENLITIGNFFKECLQSIFGQVTLTIKEHLIQVAADKDGSLYGRWYEKIKKDDFTDNLINAVLPGIALTDYQKIIFDDFITVIIACVHPGQTIPYTPATVRPRKPYIKQLSVIAQQAASAPIKTRPFFVNKMILFPNLFNPLKLLLGSKGANKQACWRVTQKVPIGLRTSSAISNEYSYAGITDNEIISIFGDQPTFVKDAFKSSYNSIEQVQWLDKVIQNVIKDEQQKVLLPSPNSLKDYAEQQFHATNGDRKNAWKKIVDFLAPLCTTIQNTSRRSVSTKFSDAAKDDFFNLFKNYINGTDRVTSQSVIVSLMALQFTNADDNKRMVTCLRDIKRLTPVSLSYVNYIGKTIKPSGDEAYKTGLYLLRLVLEPIKLFSSFAQIFSPTGAFVMGLNQTYLEEESDYTKAYQNRIESVKKILDDLIAMCNQITSSSSTASWPSDDLAYYRKEEILKEIKGALDRSDFSLLQQLMIYLIKQSDPDACLNVKNLAKLYAQTTAFNQVLPEPSDATGGGTPPAPGTSTGSQAGGSPPPPSPLPPGGPGGPPPPPPPPGSGLRSGSTLQFKGEWLDADERAFYDTHKVYLNALHSFIKGKGKQATVKSIMTARAALLHVMPYNIGLLFAWKDFEDVRANLLLCVRKYYDFTQGLSDTIVDSIHEDCIPELYAELASIFQDFDDLRTQIKMDMSLISLDNLTDSLQPTVFSLTGVSPALKMKYNTAFYPALLNRLNNSIDTIVSSFVQPADPSYSQIVNAIKNNAQLLVNSIESIVSNILNFPSIAEFKPYKVVARMDQTLKNRLDASLADATRFNKLKTILGGAQLSSSVSAASRASSSSSSTPQSVGPSGSGGANPLAVSAYDQAKNKLLSRILLTAAQGMTDLKAFYADSTVLIPHQDHPIKLLLCDSKLPAADKKTLLGQMETARFLRLDAIDPDGNTIIHYAPEFDNIDDTIIDSLVGKGLNINATNNAGENVLHKLAVSMPGNTARSDDAITKIMASVSRDCINGLSSAGRFPLEIAIENFNKPFVKMLLDNRKADINVVDTDVAMTDGTATTRSGKIVETLKKNYSDQNAVDWGLIVKMLLEDLQLPTLKNQIAHMLNNDIHARTRAATASLNRLKNLANRP